LRVAIVINTSWNIYNYRKGLIGALLEKGCEVVAIAPHDEYSSKIQALGCRYEEVKMENRGMNPFSDILLFFRLLFAYRNLKPDYVLHYTIKPNIYGSVAAKCMGIPCISNVSGLGTAFIRQGFVMQMVKLLYKFAFKIPQCIFFQNDEDRQLFLKIGLVKEAKTNLLPGSGIKVDEYVPSPYVKNHPFRFLLIARLLSDKGIVEYALASQKLKEKGVDFEAQLVGFFDRKSKYNVSELELNHWQQKGYIRFLGESKDIKTMIDQADCVVLPSYREGTPRSLLEAMAMRKPIIASKVPGCKEVLEEGENGFFCEAKNIDSLAETMEKMCNLNETQLTEMGEKGRKIAETRFDESIVIGKYFKEMFS
jgi:glycosyltransferase involved in cell wall biosynthesis